MEAALLGTHEILGYRLIGVEIPFVIGGFLMFLIFFVVRTTALLIAI